MYSSKGDLTLPLIPDPIRQSRRISELYLKSFNLSKEIILFFKLEYTLFATLDLGEPELNMFT